MKRFLARGAGGGGTASSGGGGSSSGVKGNSTFTPYQPYTHDEVLEQQQTYTSNRQSHPSHHGQAQTAGNIPRQTSHRHQMSSLSSQPPSAPMLSSYPSYGEEEPEHKLYSHPSHQYNAGSTHHIPVPYHARREAPHLQHRQSFVPEESFQRHRPDLLSYNSRDEGYQQQDLPTPTKKEGALFKGLKRHQKHASASGSGSGSGSRPASRILEDAAMQRSYSNSPEHRQPATQDSERIHNNGPSRNGSFGSRGRSTLPPHSSMVYESYGKPNGESLRSSLSLNRVDSNRQQSETKKYARPNRMWNGLAARGRALEHLLGEKDVTGPVSRTFSPPQECERDGYPQKIIPLNAPKKGNKWSDIKAKGAHIAIGKLLQEEGEVTVKIGWLCSERASPSDWSHMLSFADTLAISEEASKEAVLALRKEFKLGNPEAQKRAVKVWAVLFVNSSDIFRLQATKKSFLEVLEHTIVEPKVSLKVKERLLDAWAMLAYQYQGVPQFSVLTKSYNRVRPSDRAMNGEPLDLESEIFAIPSMERDPLPERALDRQKEEAQQYHHQQQRQDAQQTSYQDNLLPLRPLNDQSINSSLEDEQLMPEDSDDGDDPDTIQLLFQACDVARHDADLLIDALTSAGLHSEDVRELDRHCRHSLELLNSQMEWTNLQVARAHFHLAEETVLTEGQEREVTGQPTNPSEGKEVIQERLLANMEEARELLTASLAIVEEAQREEIELEEERRVTELSKIDYRVDRSTLQQDATTGELFSPLNADTQRLSVPGTNGPNASGSRTASPQQASRPLPDLHPSAAGVDYRWDEFPTSDYSTPLADVSRRPSEVSASSAVRIDRSPVRPQLPFMPSMQRLPTNLPLATSSPSIVTSSGSIRAADLSSDSTLDVMAPSRPSEKALGKRRALSTDEMDVQLHQVTDQADQLALDDVTAIPSGGSGLAKGPTEQQRFSPTGQRMSLHTTTNGVRPLPSPVAPPNTFYAADQPAVSLSHLTSPADLSVSTLAYASPAIATGVHASARAQSATQSMVASTTAPAGVGVATSGGPPSLPPLPAAYRAEQQFHQQQQRDRHPPPLPTPATTTYPSSTVTTSANMVLQSKNPYAQFH